MSIYFKSAMKCDHRPLHEHLFNTDRAFRSLQNRESELQKRNESFLTSSSVVGEEFHSPSILKPEIVEQEDVRETKRDNSVVPGRRHGRRSNSPEIAISERSSTAAPPPNLQISDQTANNVNQPKKLFVESLRFSVRSGSGIFASSSSSMKIDPMMKSATIAPTNSVVVANSRPRQYSICESSQPDQSPQISRRSKSNEKEEQQEQEKSEMKSIPTSESASKCLTLFERMRSFSRDLEDETQTKVKLLHKEAEKDFRTNRFKTDGAVRDVPLPVAVSEESDAILRTLVQGSRSLHNNAQKRQKAAKRQQRLNQANNREREQEGNYNEDDDDDDDDDRDANGKLKLKIGLSNASRNLEFVASSSSSASTRKNVYGIQNDQIQIQNPQEIINNAEAQQPDLAWQNYLRRSGKSCDYKRSDHATENLQKLEVLQDNVRNNMYDQIWEFNKARREDLSYKLMWRTIEQGGELLLTPEQRREKKQLAEMSSIALKRMMKERKRREKEDALQKKSKKKL